MIFKQIRWSSDKDITPTHEEIPQEELWEDGELNSVEVQQKILHHTFQQGDWLLVRKIDNG
jgi:hypothetical protein